MSNPENAFDRIIDNPQKAIKDMWDFLDGRANRGDGAFYILNLLADGEATLKAWSNDSVTIDDHSGRSYELYKTEGGWNWDSLGLEILNARK